MKEVFSISSFLSVHLSYKFCSLLKWYSGQIVDRFLFASAYLGVSSKFSWDLLQVLSENVTVKDSGGKQVESQILPLLNASISLRNYYSKAYLGKSSSVTPKYWLAFAVSVPPLGFNTYIISNSKQSGYTCDCQVVKLVMQYIQILNFVFCCSDVKLYFMFHFVMQLLYQRKQSTSQQMIWMVNCKLDQETWDLYILPTKANLFSISIVGVRYVIWLMLNCLFSSSKRYQHVLYY